VRVDEHTITTEYGPVHYRSAPGTEPPALYLHGVPASSEYWTPFLERAGGIAPDLIGFGRSAKGGHLDYSPLGLAESVERFLTDLGVDRVKLVGHGWGGAVAMLLASRAPARIERLVVIDGVPLSGDLELPRVVRLMRTPAIGELLMGSVTRLMLARFLRKGTVRPDAWSDPQLRSIWEQFDQGTQRALLRLHRAAAPARLAELGSEVGSLELPALVVWGERDPWLGPALADAYAARLPAATVRRIPDAGHWPWLDEPEVVEAVTRFLAM
jgi:pimeloyl-ACP methyl ester carboxylesterase